MLPATGEIALAAELLILAAQDAIQPMHVKRQPAAVQADARLFCLAQSGLWRRAREAWCGVVGLDPDTYRLAVLRMVAAAASNPIAQEGAERPRSLRHPRRAVSRQSGRRRRRLQLRRA